MNNCYSNNQNKITKNLFQPSLCNLCGFGNFLPDSDNYSFVKHKKDKIFVNTAFILEKSAE